MSRSSNEGSWGRRKSLFALSALSPITPPEEARSRLVKKGFAGRLPNPSLVTDLNHSGLSLDSDQIKSAPPMSDSARARRASFGMKGGVKRAPYMFESLRSLRSSSDGLAQDDIGEPLSATSTTTPSINFPDGTLELYIPAKTVVLHGDVQTSAGMFRKKREYLVLTETHMHRCKSHAKAAETYMAIPHPVGRSPTMKHGSMPSVGSQGSFSDLQTMSESSSGDKGGRMPLRQAVAAHRLDDSKTHSALEVCYLDEDSSQASAVTLHFGSPEERDVWLKNIRRTINEVRLRESTAISAFNLENAARVVERDHDYDPANCAIYKIVQKNSAAKPGSRASSDDVSKIASTVCFLAIGIHKVHLVPLAKMAARNSTSAITTKTLQASYGILTLTSLAVNSTDDTFELTFRQPLQGPKTLYLASSASHEIAARLHFAENFLRPECGHRLFRFNVPLEVNDLLGPAVISDGEHSHLDRTLSAYCVAYGGNPSNVRYTINYTCEDAPRFELLAPADPRRPEYSPLDLLAIMRALRYNESFGSISFAGVPLDSLNGLHDNYGHELVCSHTKRGTPIKLTSEELSRSCLLVQEVRALAATNKRLRRMDFSGCITSKPAVPADSLLEDDSIKARDIGCGIVEALFPLCKHQTTNVDWICLNAIDLSETDLDYLIAAAVEKSCHFRAIELNRCGLNDRSMGLILDAFRAQDNTLEGLEIAGNTARLNPAIFDGQVGVFGFIRKLNLSWVSRTSGNEPLLTAETLLIWRLQELRLSGTTLNSETIDAIATYLAHPHSNSLHELYVDNAYLSGGDIAILLYSMTRDSDKPCDLHLDISQNHLTKDLDQVTQAIASGKAPSHLSMRAIEYREEASFRKMIAALTANKTIQFLDMSQTALPGDASDETCRALERLLAENDTLQELDLSGEDSRLATSKFGDGLNQALVGLKQNKSIQRFRIEKQKLGLQGSSTLADVLTENKVLRELHCANNEIPLQGLTDLVNSLIDNMTLVYLPTMDDGRAAAFKSAELTMKGMSDLDSPPNSPPQKPSPLGGASALRRSFANVRKTAARSASGYTPSFPALPRTVSSSEGGNSSPRPFSLTSTRNREDSHSSASSPISFTVQDIQTTHRLLTEQWDRQCYRLAQYLDRNWCLLNNITPAVEIEDEKFERSEPVPSGGKLLSPAKWDPTPPAEKERYTVSAVESPPGTNRRNTSASLAPPIQKSSLSFKHFLLDGGVDVPNPADPAAGLSRLSMDTNTDTDEPKTPTQAFLPP